MSFNYGLRPIVIQKITMAGTAASIASSAFGAGTEYVRICSSTDFHIIFGASPTADADDIFIPADQPEILKVSPGQKIAVFHGSSTDVYVTEMGA